SGHASWEQANGALGAPGFGATVGGVTGLRDMANTFLRTDVNGIPVPFSQTMEELTPGGMLNELARPLGLNWKGDPILTPGAASQTEAVEEATGFTSKELDFFEAGEAGEAGNLGSEAGAAGSEASAAGAELNGLGALGGAVGLA